MRRAVDALAAVDGVVAVVLGGSQARGTARADSDVDLGVYYAEATPFAVAEIERLASALSHDAPPVVTDFYEWGPWVNGGAWIRIAGGKLDLLYRCIEHVERTLDEAERGIHHHHYGQQPAFGFYSVIYLAETRDCVPLHDPRGVIARLKARVAAYPPALRRALVTDWLWSAEFTLVLAGAAVRRADAYMVAGCVSRIAAALTQVLYALNEVYFAGDKGALEAIGTFAFQPPQYVPRLRRLLAQPGETMAELTATLAATERLWRDVAALAGEMYIAKYPGFSQ